MNKLIPLFLCLACHAPPSPHDVELPAEAPIQDAALDKPKTVATLPEASVSPQKILLIGDSEVMYMSWYFSRTKVKQPNETVFFDSKPGTTIGAWNNMFVREMNKYPNLDTVIIFLGTNNFNFNFLQPHQNILEEIKRRNIKCIWAGPTDVRMHGFKNLHMTGPLIKNAVDGLCTYFDTEQSDIELADGVHPTLAGATKWLQEIWETKNRL